MRATDAIVTNPKNKAEVSGHFDLSKASLQDKLALLEELIKTQGEGNTFIVVTNQAGAAKMSTLWGTTSWRSTASVGTTPTDIVVDRRRLCRVSSRSRPQPPYSGVFPSIAARRSHSTTVAQLH